MDIYLLGSFDFAVLTLVVVKGKVCVEGVLVI